MLRSRVIAKTEIGSFHVFNIHIESQHHQDPHKALYGSASTTPAVCNMQVDSPLTHRSSSTVIYQNLLIYIILTKNMKLLGEFTMVSQPIGLILVDWFVFHFCIGRLPFFFIFFRSSYFIFFSRFYFSSSSIFIFFEVILVFQKKIKMEVLFHFHFLSRPLR